MKQRMKRLQQLIEDCYRELYRESEPSANFDELIEKAPLDEMGRKIIDYENYYLADEKFKEIAEKYKSKMKMNRYEENSFNLAIYLGATPTSTKQN